MVEPPLLAVPDLALKACVLTVLPADRAITWAELEAAYMLRGQHLVECEMARRLAVETLLAQRQADQLARSGRPPPRRPDPG